MRFNSCLIIPAVYAGAGTDYSVQGDNWDGICADGLKQSPINIESSAALHKFDWDRFRPVNYDRETTWDVMFDGGVKLVPHDHEIKMSGGHLKGDAAFDNQFVLAQAHFHWGDADSKGSEHTLNDEQYFAEIHFVHYNAKYGSLTPAVPESDGLAVLGWFIEVVEDDLFEDNFFDRKLRTILETAQDKLTNEEFGKPDESDFSMSDRKRRSLDDDTVENVVVTFEGAIAPEAYKLKDYYRYSGSLTTPTCNESVQWTVFKKPLKISAKTAQMLHSADVIKSSDKNFRNTQPLNGREVTYYHSDLFSAGVATQFSIGLMAILFMFQ